MTDERNPRAGSMSDADRALLGLKRRTPVQGVTVIVGEFDEDERTPPPSDVEELIRRLWPLRHADELLGGLSTQVTRLEGRADRLEELAGGLAAIGDHIAEDAEVHREITEMLADVHGKSGNNGKLGELKRRVDVLSTRAWMILVAAVGSIGAAAVKLVIVTRAFDAVESRTAHNTEQVAVLQSQVLALTTAMLSRTRYRPALPVESDSP